MLESLTKVIDRLNLRSNNQKIVQTEGDFKEKQPFRIRGHHLPQYGFLLILNTSPSKQAELSTKIYLFRRQISQDQKELASIKDTIGFTGFQARRYRCNIQKLYERFMMLSPDYPIEILEGKRDDICTGCVSGAGKHCTTKYGFSPALGQNFVNYDGSFVDKFLIKAQELNLSDQIAVENEQTEFTDAKPEQVRVVKTSSAILKTILHEIPINGYSVDL